jgi:hypothetical protein
VAAAASNAMAACLVEAAWSARLDPAAFHASHDRFHVVLGTR